MISLQEARAIIAQNVGPLAPISISLAQAHQRILRRPAATLEDLPGFDRSAMDGYALNGDDMAEKFRIVGEIQPGCEPTVEIGPGECARIFTGAQIPRGASVVIMQENTRREGDWIIVERRDPQTWIRKRGEDARVGDVLLKEGERLTAGSLSLLAQLGITEPEVSPRPRAIHFTTGNELVAPSATPKAGQIRDSNSSLIAALLAEAQAELVRQDRCADSLDLLVSTIEASPADSWDLLLISGGASVGDYDFGARALERLGFTVHFRKINLRPGKPLVFATRGSQGAFVIPGNPLSHFITYQVAIRLAVERMEGAAPRWSMVRAELAAPLISKPDPRETWNPARVSLEAGVLKATPLAWQSSGDLRVLPATNALIPVAPQEGSRDRGAAAECLLLDLPA